MLHLAGILKPNNLDNSSAHSAVLLFLHVLNGVNNLPFLSNAIKPCIIAEIPMQDIFAIGSEGRMNVPSTTGGINWQWRMTPEMFSDEKVQWLKEMSVLYGRNA